MVELEGVYEAVWEIEDWVATNTAGLAVEVVFVVL